MNLATSLPKLVETVVRESLPSPDLNNTAMIVFHLMEGNASTLAEELYIHCFIPVEKVIYPPGTHH